MATTEKTVLEVDRRDESGKMAMDAAPPAAGMIPGIVYGMELAFSVAVSPHVASTRSLQRPPGGTRSSR